MASVKSKVRAYILYSWPTRYKLKGRVVRLYYGESTRIRVSYIMSVLARYGLDLAIATFPIQLDHLRKLEILRETMTSSESYCLKSCSRITCLSHGQDRQFLSWRWPSGQVAPKISLLERVGIGILYRTPAMEFPWILIFPEIGLDSRRLFTELMKVVDSST